MAEPEDPGTFITAGNEQGVEFPENDNDMADMHVSESTRLHKKMREMKEMDDALAAMKRDYARRIKLVKQGSARFLKRQKNTIEYLRKFKQFILETDTKRTRAEKKELEEKKAIDQKIKTIRELTEQLAEKKRTTEKKKNKHERIKQYQSYLESVLSNSEQYTEIDELLTRYKILDETRSDLLDRSDVVGKEQEGQQMKLLGITRDKQNDILVKNSTLARQLKVLEDQSNDTSSMENNAITSDERSKHLNRTVGEIQMAIRNIHMRICDQYPTTPQLRRQQEKAGNNATSKQPQITSSETKKRDESR